MQRVLSRLFIALLVLAGLYLVVVNAALNLPATRDYLNRLQPDTFAVSWRRAYSPWPLRVVFTGVAADGATPMAQWQVDAGRVGASVSIPALFRGEVLLHHLALTDLDLRLRPLPGPEDDFSRIAGFFPVVRNRDPAALAGPAPAPEPGTLVVELDDIRISGEHNLWVGQTRGELTGDIGGNLRMDTATGELSLAEGGVDLALTGLTVGPQQHVTDGAMIRGGVDIKPFAPAETQGLEFMRVGDLDVTLDLPVQSLAFVSWLMPPAAALDLHGRGQLSGRLALAGGEMLSGTGLIVEAHELAMAVGAYRFRGDGSVELRVDPLDEAQADLWVRFDQVRASLPDADAETPDVLFTGRGLTAQLRAAVESRGAGHDIATLDMTGTEVRLDDARLASAEQAAGAAPPWAMRLAVTEADLGIPLSPAQVEAGAVRAVATTLSEAGFGAVLATADGEADTVLTVSSLDWIAALLGRPVDLGLQGQGELDVDIVLDDGWPDAGSVLRIPKDPLSVRLLDYRIDATGSASLQLERGGKQPKARLVLALEDGRARRRDEDEPSADQVRMDAELLVRDPFAGSVEDATADAELKAKIHSAAIPDMRTYNPYLPGHGPVAFTGGAASLVGDLAMTANSASGQLLLTADDVGVQVAEASLGGDLRLELLIRDGAAQDLRFDITGFSLTLSGFNVTGATASSTDQGWQARLQMEDTELVWQKPMQLDLEADVTVQDTRPFIALVDDLRAEHSWLEDLLVMEDLAGHLVLDVDGDTAVIEDAMLSGPQIGVHAKGRADERGREGMLLLRWQSLSGALEIEGARRHFDVVDARGRFDAYLPGRTPLPALRAGAAASADTPATAAPAEVAAPAPAMAPAPAPAPPTAGGATGGGPRPSGRAHAPGPRPKPAQPGNPFLDHSL